MDGASKFVRGDAIAGIIIMLLNLVGGLIVGVLQHNMELGQAAKNYTLSLTPKILSATKTTHIETDIAPASIISGDLSATLTAHQIQTHRLQLQ